MSSTTAALPCNALPVKPDNKQDNCISTKLSNVISSNDMTAKDTPLNNSQNKDVVTTNKDISPAQHEQKQSSVAGDEKDSSPSQQMTNEISASSSSSMCGTDVNGAAPAVEASSCSARRPSAPPAPPRRHSPEHANYRKLSIQPRTTQYEPNALLQGRSEAGRTELEELLMEAGGRRGSQLTPRSAQYERSALLERNAAGVTQLEVVLQERERELSTRAGGGGAVMMKAGSVDSTASTASARRERMMLRQQSMPERPPLQPRYSQYEQHSLMETKDDSGLSILDAFLKEKELELDTSDSSSITSKGKCSEKCTCKNANCTVCKPVNQQSAGGKGHQALVKRESSRETVIEPKASYKRVHFSEGKGNNQENENEELEDACSKEGLKYSTTDDKSQKLSNNKDSPIQMHNSVVGNTPDNNVDKSKAEKKSKTKDKHKCVVS